MSNQRTNFEVITQENYELSSSEATNPPNEKQYTSNNYNRDAQYNEANFKPNLYNDNIGSNSKNEADASHPKPSKENNIVYEDSDFPVFKNIKRHKSVRSAGIPPNDIFLARISFLVFGVSGFVNWTVVLNSSFAIFSTVYDYPRGADTILLGYFGLSFIIALLRFYFRTLNPIFVHIGIVSLYIANIALPLSIYTLEGTMGVVMMHLIGLIIGVGVSLIISNGMAYAAIIPVNMTGFVMAGQGLAGVIGFASWQFLTRLFFNPNNKQEIRYAAFAMFSLCFLLAFLMHILFFIISKKDWMKDSISEFGRTSHLKLDPEVAKQSRRNDHSSLTYAKTNLEGVRPIKYVVRDAQLSMFLGIFTIFITFTLFPNIGPYDWNGLSLANVSILVGIFQTIDFIGRFLPNLRGIFILPYRLLKIFVPLRIIFFPIFILFTQMESPFFTSFATQLVVIILLACTNGFISSQAISDVPRRVITTGERGVIGLVLNIAMQCSIALGILISQLIKLTYNLF